MCFAINGYSDVSNYEVGDVFESKKRTTSVVLYKFKADLLMLLSNTHQLRRSESRHDSYPYSGSLRYLEPRYKYDLQKGDKIILLDRLEEQENISENIGEIDESESDISRLDPSSEQWEGSMTWEVEDTTVAEEIQKNTEQI